MPLTDIHTVSIATRGKVFFRKYQYINGQGMQPIAAEEKARSDFGIAPMNKDEKNAAQSKGLVDSFLDNKYVAASGFSSKARAVWAEKIEGKPLAKNEREKAAKRQKEAKAEVSTQRFKELVSIEAAKKAAQNAAHIAKEKGMKGMKACAEKSTAYAKNAMSSVTKKAIDKKQ